MPRKSGGAIGSRLSAARDRQRCESADALRTQTALTLDMDWAPDAAIDHCVNLLLQYEVKATFFLTHDSPAVDRIRGHLTLFELGIHPNFLAGSSHGNSPGAVLRHCMRLAPGARAMRTHALVQSTPLLRQTVLETPIRIDSSLLLSHARLTMPFALQLDGNTMVRVPFHWEDDVEMIRKWPSWKLPDALNCMGVRVFNFHPMHVCLNSSSMSPYNSLKASAKSLRSLTAAEIRGRIRAGAGAGSLFESLVRHTANHGGGLTISDVARPWFGGDTN